MRLLFSVIFIAALAISVKTLGASCTASAEAVFSVFEFEIDECEVKKIAGKDGFSVDLTKLETGDETRDSHMRNKYLEVSKYPKATFVFTSKNKDTFSGMLSFHGKKRKISGVRNGKTYTFKIDVTKFGVKIPEYGSITIAKMINIIVEL